MEKEKDKRKSQESSTGKRKEQRKITTRWKPTFWTQEPERMADGWPQRIYWCVYNTSTWGPRHHPPCIPCMYADLWTRCRWGCCRCWTLRPAAANSPPSSAPSQPGTFLSHQWNRLLGRTITTRSIVLCPVFRIRIHLIRIILVAWIRIRIRIRIYKLDQEQDQDPHQSADVKPKCMEYKPMLALFQRFEPFFKLGSGSGSASG